MRASFMVLAFVSAIGVQVAPTMVLTAQAAGATELSTASQKQLTKRKIIRRIEQVQINPQPLPPRVNR